MKFTKILERVSNRRTRNKDKIFTAFIQESLSQERDTRVLMHEKTCF